MTEWKETCNLPRTAFSMKANLQTAEPEAVARWDAMDLYGKIRRPGPGAPKYLLHDGPPYANGEIHMGTALNKILKDFVVKSHNMLGFDAPYVPGWDCHGLPIELKVDRELGPKKREMATADFRRACRSLRREVRRHPARRLQAPRHPRHVGRPLPDDGLPTTRRPSSARSARSSTQDMVYKGKKPVHWCTHCRTALAEAEVEYEPHTSPSIYVEFPLSEASRGELAARVPALAGRRVSVLIWTTTPWTIPSNLAIAFHPDFEYGAYDVDGTAVIVAKELAATRGRQDRSRLRHPAGDVRRRGDGAARASATRSTTRDSLAVLADYVTLEAGTGAVHTAPGHGADDYDTGVKYGLDIYAPVDAGGHYNDTVELFAGLQVWEANPKRRSGAAASAAACGTARTSITRTRTAGAATTR